MKNIDVIMKLSDGSKQLYSVGNDPIPVTTGKITEPYESVEEIVNDLMKILANCTIKMKYPYKVYDETYTIEYITNKLEGTMYVKELKQIV